MPNTTYKPGQKWISNAEPELGMGRIVEEDGRLLTIFFDLVDEVRTYAKDQAPITRAKFGEGDTVRSSAFSIVVESVTDSDGLLVYHGHYQGTATAIIETDLDPNVRFSKPEQRLLTHQIDDNRWFNLRYLTLMHRASLDESSVRGLIGPRVSLVPHQFYIASEVASRHAPRVLLADEVGLGKTIEAGLIIHQQLTTGRAARVLVIVPPALTFQWFVEMIRRFNLRFTLLDEERCQLIEEDNRAEDDAEDTVDNPFEAQQLMLCTLDLLLDPKRLEQALSAEWDLIVVDEAHHLEYEQGAPSPEYEVVDALAAVARGLLLLTATPEQLGRLGHFSRLRLLDPSRYHDFDVFTAEEAGYEDIAVLVRELTSAADPSSAREEIGRRLDMQGSDDELIDALLDRHGTGRVLFRNVRDSVGGFPDRVLHTYPLTGEENLTDILQDPRLDWLVKLGEASDEKFLVICSRADTAIRIERHLKEKTTLRSAAFHEGMDLVSRDRAANYFADTEFGAQLLICSEIGSEGRNFQFASNLVMFDLPFAPDLVEQRIGRLDRIGQLNDVKIHVPYIEGSAQHDLLRWYEDGLKLFREPNPVAQKIFDDQLPRIETDNLDDIIRDSAEATAEQLALLAEGRDQLLERNSHRPEISSSLIAEVDGHDDAASLETYMELSFDAFGLESEPLFDDIQVVKPTEGMVRHAPVSAETMDRFHYPELPEEGVSITYRRDTALSREDVQFITWESPLVEEAMDTVLSDFTGNCSVIAVTLPGVQRGTVLLETIHIVECIAPAELIAARFLPAKVIRSLITAGGDDVADKVGFNPFEDTLDIAKEALAKIVASQEDGIKQMLRAATQSATQKLLPVKTDAMARMQRNQDLEIERLTQLARVNPNVREDEIDYVRDAKEALTDAIDKADLRLEAVRLIIAA